MLAQADAAEEDAARLEAERQTLEKELDRLTAVVSRMEDMQYSTTQLTNQMKLDTALQMRHILENGKSIVPRVSLSAQLSLIGRPHLHLHPIAQSVTELSRATCSTSLESWPNGLPRCRVRRLIQALPLSVPLCWAGCARKPNLLAGLGACDTLDPICG